MQTALRAVESWGLSREQLEKVKAEAFRVLAETAKEETRLMAVRVIQACQAQDIQLMKVSREADREDARLVLDAHAAALADPRYLDAISNVPPPQRLPAPAPTDTGEQPST